MMVAYRKKQNGEPAGCPVHQMTFGEVVRYLQGAYEPPVQRAITSHVKYCNACAAELERVKALRKAGEHIFAEHLVDFGEAPEGVKHVEEALLAAFVDDALSQDDRAEVAEHLASCHFCYHQYAAVISDVASPVAARYRAPARSIESVLALVPSASFGQSFRAVWHNVASWSERVLGGPWRAPTLALALGVLVMLILIPGLKKSTVISLQALHQNGEDPDQVISGSLHAFTLKNDVLILTPGSGSRVSFTWPAVEERTVTHYRVSIYDENNTRISEQDVKDNKWSVSRATLRTEGYFTINVVAFYEGGGVRPVIRAQKIRAE